MIYRIAASWGRVENLKTGCDVARMALATVFGLSTIVPGLASLIFITSWNFTSLALLAIEPLTGEALRVFYLSANILHPGSLGIQAGVLAITYGAVQYAIAPAFAAFRARRAQIRRTD